MPGSQGEGEAIQEFTRAMKLTQESIGARVDPNHKYIHNHQCPRCHLKYKRSTDNPFDNTTYWQNCSRECLLGEERKVILKVAGPGLEPHRSYDDDCGLDLYTHCAEPTNEDEFRDIATKIWADIFYKNPDDLCTLSNFSRWQYRVMPHSFVDIDCGINIELPEGLWGLITGRSSAIRKKGLLIPNGIIDTGYRGRLFMPVQNMTSHSVVIEPGERIGQLILMQNISLGVQIERVEQLAPSARGEQGRGSTGK